MNDGPKHDEMETLVSQSHLLMLSAFTAFELWPNCIACSCGSHERAKTTRRGVVIELELILELELELIQTHMAQKPLLRVEVGAQVILHHKPLCRMDIL